MFRVLPFCRVVTGVLWLAGVLVLYKLGMARASVFILAALGLWVQYHLLKVRVYFEKGIMIKKRGSFFNRKQVFVLKNLISLQTIVFADVLPGIVVMNYPGEKAFLIGFSGRQIGVIEKYVKKNLG